MGQRVADFGKHGAGLGHAGFEAGLAEIGMQRLVEGLLVFLDHRLQTLELCPPPRFRAGLAAVETGAQAGDAV
jgi:hypothetical protein